MENNYLGIVVSSIDHKEKNQIVSVFTQEGYKSIYVRNAKEYNKGNMGFCMPFTLVKFASKGNDMQTLVSYEIIESYNYIKDDYFKSLYAYAILFLLKTPHEVRYDRRIFDFLIKIFNRMKDVDSKKLYSLFLTKMTIIFGGKPHLNDCVICNNKMIYDFSIKHGGFVCKTHYSYDNEYLNGTVFKRLYELDIDGEFFEFDNDKYFEFIKNYYQKLSLANLYQINKLL